MTAPAYPVPGSDPRFIEVEERDLRDQLADEFQESCNNESCGPSSREDSGGLTGRCGVPGAALRTASPSSGGGGANSDPAPLLPAGSEPSASGASRDGAPSRHLAAGPACAGGEGEEAWQARLSAVITELGWLDAHLPGLHWAAESRLGLRLRRMASDGRSVLADVAREVGR